MRRPDVDDFLAQPLVARVATNGPDVRPVWFLWEDGAFWWLTGPWSRLAEHLRDDPTRWDQDRFGVTEHGVAGSEQTAFIRLVPTRLAARDVSFATAPGGLSQQQYRRPVARRD